MEREGLVSLAMVPIVSKEDVHGFIALGSKRFHDFSEIELRLISDASSRLGTALTNARLFHAAKARTADLEQRLYEQLVQLERLSRLKRFLSSHLAEMILAGGPNDPLKAHRREITVVYLGLTGFAAFAAYSEYEEVMKVLRQYHREMGRLILECDGTLERFAGDRMMVVFNDPVEIANPAKRAVRMALAMRERVKELSQEWCRFNYDLGFHAGIAHGFATLGVIGYEGRIDYGAIGRVTNIASGLCDEAKYDQILVSQRVAGLVEDIVQSEVAGNLTLRDFPVPVMAHALVRLKD